LSEQPTSLKTAILTFSECLVLEKESRFAGEDTDAINQFILNHTKRTKLYTLFTRSNIQKIIDQNLTNDQDYEILDFILNLSCRFKAMLSSQEYENLIEIISETTGFDPDKVNNDQVFFGESFYKDNFQEKKIIKQLLQNNNWLIVLYMLCFLVFKTPETSKLTGS
jgi:hypothetical protein